MKVPLTTANRQPWSDSSEAEPEGPARPFLRLNPDHDDLDTGQLQRAPTRVMNDISAARHQARFELLQQWEGTIEGVDADSITASVRDMTDRTMPDELIEIQRMEFADADADLVAPGAVFYWSIGYRVTPSGTKERLSVIRMRRLPQPTRRQLECISREAAELSRMFGGYGCDADLSTMTTASDDSGR